MDKRRQKAWLSGILAAALLGLVPPLGLANVLLQPFSGAFNEVRNGLRAGRAEAVGQQDGTWVQESGVPRHSASGATAGGIGGLLAITEVSGTSTNILLPISDHVGTIHALVAAMTNSVALSEPIIVETRTYSPYGDLIEVDRPLLTANCKLPTVHCPFGFQSKYYDAETGFWYYGYRYYDAKSAKWLTADPLGEAGGLNLTAFCGGDPVNQIDPLGLEIGVVPSGRAWQSLLVTYEDAGPYYYGTELWEAPIAGFANIATFAANTLLGAGSALHELLGVNINDPGAEWAAVFPAAPLASIAMAEHGVGMLASRAWGAIAATRAGTKVGNLASSAREWSARSIGRIFGNNAAITGNPGAVQLPTRPSIAAKTTPSLDALSQAAGAADRGSLTVAGRSLTKHGAGARAGNTIFPAGKGNPLTINQIAQDIVDDILTAPGSTIQGSTRGRFGPTLEVTAPNGQGIVYGANGKFLFFKE